MSQPIQAPIIALARRAGPLLTALAALTATALTVDAQSAQDRWGLRGAWLPSLQDERGSEKSQKLESNAWAKSFIEFSLSGDSAELGYQTLTEREDGFFGINLIANEDEGVGLSARLMRVGQVVDFPVRLGVGIGAYSVFFKDEDESAYAVALTGIAEYDIRAAYPTVLRAELSIAPDITTFGDGDDLLDFQLQLDVKISEYASTFIGVHVLEVDTETDTRELVDGFRIGVRLGF